jgi:hypothetical protein
MADEEQAAALRTAYDQLCQSYRAIDDFRAKLLGFLPLVTGGGLVLVTGRANEAAQEFLLPVGLFGLVVTLGLFAFELFGIEKCAALIDVGEQLEASLKLPAGQFARRPRELLGHINEPFAASIIYPAVMAAWAYLAGRSRGGLGVVLSIALFVVAFGLTAMWNYRKGQARARAAGSKAPESPKAWAISSGGETEGESYRTTGDVPGMARVRTDPGTQRSPMIAKAFRPDLSAHVGAAAERLRGVQA